MKRMLFNATHTEELRVAIVNGQELLDLDIEATLHNHRKGNIYKGRITRVEPSLEAAFVEYGSERQGFLPLKEISRVLFRNYDSSTPISSVRIADVVEVDQELIVQVTRDERGNKGAALTTFVALAGRFIVLMPNNPKGGGISRRISGEERMELRDAIARLDINKGDAVIARTAGIGRSDEELNWDFEFLSKIWQAIHNAAKDRPAPFLIYQENNLVIRALRDYLQPDITEILVDDEEIYDRANRFMQMIMPHNINKLKYYKDTIPLFSRYQIEHQIETAYSRHVGLPSGAQLVLDHTEAVVTIDVNSAKSTSGSDIEETALKTNLEAVDEIAKQLRIRDIGGLVVIDLIDMIKSANQRTVERRLDQALTLDRARVQVGKISRFGLLEMSRQRLRSAIGEANYIKCPRCQGNGLIRSVPSSALSILRIIEEEALKENTETVHAQLPLETATYLLNEKRHEVASIEKRATTRIILIPTTHLQSPNYEIKRFKGEEVSRENLDRPTYELQAAVANENDKNTYVGHQEQILQMSQNQPPASISINDFTLNQAPAKPVTESEKEGLFSKIKSLLNPSKEKPVEVEKITKKKTKRKTTKRKTKKKITTTGNPTHKKKTRNYRPRNNSPQRARGNRNLSRGGRRRPPKKPTDAQNSNTGDSTQNAKHSNYKRGPANKTDKPTKQSISN